MIHPRVVAPTELSESVLEVLTSDPAITGPTHQHGAGGSVRLTLT